MSTVESDCMIAPVIDGLLSSLSEMTDRLNVEIWRVNRLQDRLDNIPKSLSEKGDNQGSSPSPSPADVVSKLQNLASKLDTQVITLYNTMNGIERIV